MNDQQRWAGQQPEWEPPHGQPPQQGFPPPAGGPPPRPAYAPGPPMPPSGRSHRSGPPGGGNRKLVVGAVASVVALAVIGGGIWFATSDDDGDSGNTAQSVGNSSTSPAPASASPSQPAAQGGETGGTAGASASASASASSSAAGSGKCTPASGPPKSMTFPSVPPMTIDKNASYDMTLKTSCGTITVRLDAAKAPNTVNSFAFLAGRDYFDHTPCHRLTTEGIFVLQCGDPTGRGTGGPGYRFDDENLAGATYKAGTVAMANSGPDTNGSQFFLVYEDSPLPPDYTPFGTVTAGMDILRAIGDNGVWDGSGDGIPKSLVTLDDVTVARK
ncbi:MAG TPA: peptidylprolyl isomerase [Yinghuangia sp.]|uniref:peptidylprolyl isomerase n=1 Tax=Yinghuangia sp. YIM S10712 TaxID=3436930 RepID=UPI002B740ECF|nr:peptidylprolyl isomerase [Yinghuangia sp.]